MGKGKKTAWWLAAFWLFLIAQFVYARLDREPYPGFMLPSFGHTSLKLPETRAEDPTQFALLAINGTDTLDLFSHPVFDGYSPRARHKMAADILRREELKTEYPSFSFIKKWRWIRYKPQNRQGDEDLKNWIFNEFLFQATHVYAKCSKSYAHAYNISHEHIFKLH